jgi:hypothetical protein
MNKKPFATVLAIILTVTIGTSAIFFTAPQRAHAIWGIGDITFDPTNYVANYGSMISNGISVVKETLTSMNTYTSMIAQYADNINTYVLQPLAFVLSGNLIKAMTASVVKFVIGQANGTGIPQFVTDLDATMRTVGDSQALAFFTQWGKNSNSPFASSIGSSLRSNYLKNTSLAGFWAANMCTLSQSSRDVNGFLAGDWSKGGATAWFALTTQSQNNPFSLYQIANSQLDTLIFTAKDVRQKDIAAGQGFMSWCGGSETTSGAVTTTPSAKADAYNARQKADAEYGDAYDKSAEDPTNASLRSAAERARVAAETANARYISLISGPSSGVNPGDPCNNADGTSGTIKTPGSVIAATFNKVLGGQQDQVLRLGNVGPQINIMLENIATVLKTVQFASQLLGGSGSGGLLGVGNASGSSPTSLLSQFTPTQNANGDFTSGYLGATNADIYQNAASSSVTAAVTSNSDVATRVNDYQAAWNTITASANTASTSVVTLISFCVEQQLVAKNTLEGGYRYLFNSFMNTSSDTITAAQTILSTKIKPVFDQAAKIPGIVAAVVEMDKKVKEALAAGSSTYNADLQKLADMPPTANDVAVAQADAKSPLSSSGSSVNSPPSFVFPLSSSISITDNMKAISANAEAMKFSACTAPGIPDSGGG